MEAWLATMDASGAHRALAVLRLILSDAKRHGLIPLNPALGLRLPSPEARSRVLTEDELVAVLTHPRQTLRIETMLRAAAEGGLRRSEICGLR